MGNSRTIVIVRTHQISERLYQLCAQLSQVIDVNDIFVVLDETSTDGADDARQISGLNGTVLPMTRRSLHRLNVAYDGPRTGWKCGDYVLYRAFSEDWEYAWVIEPDVFLLNGSEQMFVSDRIAKDVDLASVNYNIAGPEWYWRKSFSEWLPGRDVYSMAFPLFRVSRSLARSAHELRKEIFATDSTGLGERPNDESILASAAGVRGAQSLNLKSEFPKWFDFFSTVVKYHPESLASRELRPLIVHSGQSISELREYVRSELGKVLNGDLTSTARVKAMSRELSPTVLQDLFGLVVDEACSRSRVSRGLTESSGVSSERLK